MTDHSRASPLRGANGSTHSVALASVLLLSPIVFSGCSQGTAGSEEADVSSIESTTVWDASSWTPPVTVEPENLTEGERMARRTQWLDNNWGSFTAREEIELVAWTTSYAEHGQLVTDCLAESGFPSVWDGAGGRQFTGAVPASQQEALDLATYRCSAQYSLDPRILREWSADQATIMFDYWMEYYIPCMEAHGVAMNSYVEDAPSRQAYIAEFNGPNRIDWAPYLAASSMPPEEQQKIEATCPSMPPEEFMYGM